MADSEEIARFVMNLELNYIALTPNLKALETSDCRKSTTNRSIYWSKF